MALPHGLGLLLLLLLGGPGAAITIPPECEWGGGAGLALLHEGSLHARLPFPLPPCTAAHDGPVAPHPRGLGVGGLCSTLSFSPPLLPGMQMVHTIVSSGGARGGL